MAWRLQEYVTRGEIDNRTSGRVTGRIWLAGVEEPLVLDLEGNCEPDLAGCFLKFENPAPVPLDTPPPASQQYGRAGEMTASRKVLVPDVPFEEYMRLSEAGLPAPEHLANCLCLEWLSDLSGRMVIESVDFRLQLSTPEWRLIPEEKADHAANETSMKPQEAGPDVLPASEEDDEDPRPWDEFRHEQALRKQDALTDKFGKLLEKYRDHPNRDQLIAREMGWEWMEDPTDEEELEDLPDCELEDAPDADPAEWIKPEPDPTREGIDWIRTAEGEVRHPLYHRAFQLHAGLHDFCCEHGLLEETDPDLEELFSHLSLLSAKLAGALTDLADGTDLYEPGFVVALLKRALKVLNQSLAALDVIVLKPLLPATMIALYRAELLSIREGILTLVQEFRRRVS